MSFLFDSQVNYFSDSNGITELPFSVFALTQQGTNHRHWSIGNQDSASVYVGRSSIIGAVADGCTSGTNLNGKSNSQVGAYVSSYLTVRILRKLAMKRKVPIDELLPVFEHEFQLGLSRLVRTFNPWKVERKDTIRNFFLSTVIFFVLTDKGFVVANCGDGFAVVNNSRYDLSRHSGTYFAERLMNGSDPPFNEIDSGVSSNLSNVFLATDGFVDKAIVDRPLFSDFFLTKRAIGHTRGFINRRSEFRKEFVRPAVELMNGRIWPDDDATFISLQRVD